MSPWRQQVNSFVGLAFIGVFGLATVFVILDAAELSNPIAGAMEARLTELRE